VTRAVLLALCMFGVLLGGTPALAQSPCAAADALANVGRADDATKEYVSVVRKDPGAQCALDALAKQQPPAPDGKDPCAVPDALKKSGETGEAKKLYVKMLSANASEVCASDGLALLNVTDACARAAAYEDLHQDADARKIYKSVLDVRPSEQCAVDGLASVEPNAVTRKIDDIVAALPDLLLLGALVLLAGFLVLMTGYNKRVKRLLARVPLASTVLRPRLTMGGLDDAALGEAKIGLSLSTRISERLQRFREEAVDVDKYGYRLDFGGSDQRFVDVVSSDGSLESSLSKLADASEHTKLVAALLNFIAQVLPVSRLALAGVVDPPVAQAPAATLTLTNGSKMVGATTLTAPATAETPTASDYLVLCDAAAVWVSYQVARDIGGGEEKLGPGAATSYALVRKGLELQSAGQLEAAIAAYEQAVAEDAVNWSARVNLAIARARFKDDLSAAEAVLSDAIDDMEEELSGPWL
jgi:tetratricopeptide (TPR) repeat protein